MHVALDLLCALKITAMLPVIHKMVFLDESPCHLVGDLQYVACFSFLPVTRYGVKSQRNCLRCDGGAFAVASMLRVTRHNLTT